MWFEAAKKQTQFKANRRPLSGSPKRVERLDMSWRNRAFGLFKGDKARKPAGKIVFLDEFDILYVEMARFWPTGIAGQELNFFWRLML